MRLSNVFLTTLLLCLPLMMQANTRQSVVQVTTNVTVNGEVDYIITSNDPFGEEGSVDITNTEHAVLILNRVKPSKVSSLFSHIKINGVRASTTNCQVRIHNNGSIILPYPSNFKPLTVFSEENFSGEAVNDFGLENSGGFMNTLTDEKLNNRIKSFRLKRGYMVTFSTQARGRGYSRCFIAANQDVEFAELPKVLSGRISSYRIFKWNYTSKSGIANDTRADPCTKLNVTSCYSFGLGEDRGPNTECVPHHIYEDWPSASACGSVSYSPHMKTNNEPGNSADDHPQSVDDILNNWENLMATGMRLCSPSSHDGSIGHLRAFLDSIDARGWRCDIIDLHCYWLEGSFDNIKGSWVDRYKRPIWISEWVWGASWNNNGIFGVAQGSNRDNPTASQLNQNKAAVQNICSKLNSWDYIERYFYWNSEANCSKLYLSNGTLTPTGEYYAGMNTGVGYNGKYEFVPTLPRQYGLSGFKQTITDGKTVVRWSDKNGEYNELMEVQRKTLGGQWEVIADITPRDGASTYSFTDEESPEGAIYRIHIIDLNGVNHYTNDDIEVGDAVTDAEGKVLYAGGNIITNGDFNLGTVDWSAGDGTELAIPFFQVVPTGGYHGGAYLQAYGSAGIDTKASLKKTVSVKPEKEYLFTIVARSAGNNVKASLSKDGNSESKSVGIAKNTDDWLKNTFIFNSGEYSQFLMAFRLLQAKAQIDKVELRQLFESREEAVADGMEKTLLMAESVKAYNEQLPALNTELSSELSAITTSDDAALAKANAAISDLLQALSDKVAIDSLLTVAASVSDMAFVGKEQLSEAIVTAQNAETARGIIDARNQLQQTLDNFLTLEASPIQPRQPSFASAAGWETKVGSYKDGDQRTNTVRGKSCWNAWWSGLKASVGNTRTMEVRQTISDLDEGLYALECKATTEHYCLSDQHGYIATGDQKAETPKLTYDYFDLPTVGNIWQTLTTTPVYVGQGGAVTIGFVSSKEGAIDGAWKPFGNANGSGDNREGWWCATDFVLKFHPIRKMTATPGQWTTLCLPYAYDAPIGGHCYHVVGILADHSQLCIEEIPQVAAGEPCIFLADQADITIFESGEKVDSPIGSDKANGLRGFFNTSVKAPANSYVLVDGQWVLVGSPRPAIEDYTAILYPVSDIPVIDSWSGLTMPVVDPNAIHMTEAGQVATRHYTIGGQPITHPRGVVIEQKGNQTRKMIKK